MIAWLRDSTLQSNIQLFGAGLLLATERPTLDASVNNTFLSSKGWELGRDVRIAIAIFHYNHVEPIQNDGPPPMVTLRMLTQRIAGIWHVTKWTTPPPPGKLLVVYYRFKWSKSVQKLLNPVYFLSDHTISTNLYETDFCFGAHVRAGVWMVWMTDEWGVRHIQREIIKILISFYVTTFVLIKIYFPAFLGPFLHER